jgi:hypothetical protein
VQPQHRLGDAGRPGVHLGGQRAQLTHATVAGQPGDLGEQLDVGEPPRREQSVHGAEGETGRQQTTEI